MSDNSKIIDTLNSVHIFPGPFVFKVIGPNDASFVAAAAQSVINAIGPGAEPEISTRESSKKNHLAVTITAQVPDAQHVLDVYAILKELDGMTLLL